MLPVCRELGSGQYAFLLSSFKDLAGELGVSLAHKKTEDPVQQMSRFPQDKLDKLLSFVFAFLKQKLY